MDTTAEQAFLDDLYGEEEHEEEEPLLFASQIITDAKERPTYGQMAQQETLISTLNRKQGLGSTSVALGATNGGGLRSMGGASGGGMTSTSNFGPYYSQVLRPGSGGAADAGSPMQLQQHLNGVVGRVDLQRGAYEQTVLKEAKTKELVRIMEGELRSLMAEESKLSKQTL
eukprot:gene1976-33393_t